jgi:hypothetical protein
MNVPTWLQVILGVLPIPAGLKVAIEVAYAIWTVIPWFHKPLATAQLRKAARAAKLSNDPTAINVWCDAWKKKIGQT